MSLQSDQFLGFNYRVIERPFYGTFLYKIAFQGASVFGNRLSQSKIAELQKFRSLHWLIRSRAKDICGSNGFRFRQDTALNIYCKEMQHAQYLVREFENYVIDIYGPKDEAHQKQALLQPKMIVKQRLWKGRYRFKISLDLYMTAQTSFNGVMEDLVLGIDYDVNPNLESYMSAESEENWGWYSGEKILYCNDEGLIMMIGLVCTDAIRKIDKVITHNELSEQKETAAKDAGSQLG